MQAQDFVSEFRDAIANAGLEPPDTIIADGKLHRFSSSGKRGDDAGFYTLYNDSLPAGHFGCWRTRLTQNWHANIGRELSESERAAQRARVEHMQREREADRERRRAEARKRAADMLGTSREASPDHPYLIRKSVKPHGIRQSGSTLLIPLRDAATKLHSLQQIDADGDKRFLPGGAVKGCYFPIGKPNGTLLIAEGFSTGASLHEATGHAVAVAFNSGNVEPVARALRDKLPEARIILCADDDIGVENNPGLTCARAAATAVGGVVAVPDFGDDRPEGVTDFNDLARLHGAEAIKRAVERASAPDASPPQPASTSAPMAVPKPPPLDSWPDPLPVRTELYPVPAFDAHAMLPKVLADWVMDEAERMPASPEFVAATALSALGSTIGAQCAIRPKSEDTWHVVPNVWGGVVGMPAQKKTPSMDAATRPLNRLAAKAREAHQAEMQDYESAKIVTEARRDDVVSRIKMAAKKSSVESPETVAVELRALNESAPKPPTVRRFLTNDSSVEKLGELLRDNPAGLLVLRDELTGLLSSWDREGHEGDRAFYLEGWSGTGGFSTDRIGRGNVEIPNLCVTVAGGIQPDKLLGYLEQASDGLSNDGTLQRFQLLVYPDPCKWEWRDRKPNTEARDAAYALFERLAELEPVSLGAKPADAVVRFPTFRFDPAAQGVFIEWCTELHQRRIPAEQQDGSLLLAQHLSKYEKLFAGLALIFHLAECVSTSTSGPVTVECAIRAAAWCEFLEAHARRCYSLLDDEGARSARVLAARLAAGAFADGFTPRDVRRKRWRYLTTDKAVAAGIQWLEEDGWLRALNGPAEGTPGRPTIRYAVNPKARKTGKWGAAEIAETPLADADQPASEGFGDFGSRSSAHFANGGGND